MPIIRKKLRCCFTKDSTLLSLFFVALVVSRSVLPAALMQRQAAGSRFYFGLRFLFPPSPQLAPAANRCILQSLIIIDQPSLNTHFPFRPLSKFQRFLFSSLRPPSSSLRPQVSNLVSMISVIIPNYNGAKFLREAIDSALDQQGVELEVIVVDDGSTDTSRDVIESYGDRIRPIFQDNQGAPAARNAGLAIARGESVLFLDSDDLLYLDALQGMSLELDQLGEGYALYGDARWMQQEVLLLHDRSYLPPGLVPPAALIGQNILTGRVLHQMSNVRSVGGFDISLPRGQEFDLHFRLALQGVTFVHFPADVLYYRIHASEYRISSKGFSGNDPNYFLQLNAKHTELLNQSYPEMWPDQVKTRMAQRLWEIGRGLIREGGREQAVPYFEAAKGLSPMNCISGGRVYEVLARLLGPIYAERIGSFITSNYSD